MRLIFFFVFILSSVMAAPRVAILTSLTEIKIQKKIDHLIEKELSNFEVKVIHKATQDELYQEILLKPDALIWVSHGSEAQAEVGIGATPQVLDYQKDDISPLFQILSPKSQFLSVVSCFAKSSMKFQKIKMEDLSGSYFPEGKVVAISGFKKAIKKLKETSFHEMSEPTLGPSLHMKREFGDNISLKVFQGQKFLGLLKNESSFIPSKGNIRLEYPRYLNVPSENEWGKISLESFESQFSLFTDKQGKPFGTYSRVFINVD
jgi:hypothetical protein